MRSKLVLLILALTVIFAACAPVITTPAETAEPSPAITAAPVIITLTDLRGKGISFEQPFARVISLAPSNTEILFAVGAGAQVFGRDPFSDFPAEALSIADIGGGFGPLNTEVILAASPDLILAADLTPAEQIQALEDLGLTVFVVPNPTDIAGMYENLRVVATLTGHTEQAEALIASLQVRVAAIEQKLTAVTDKPLVFYELDATEVNAPFTAGPGTFVDTLITQAGGLSLGSSLSGAWVQVSLEQLIVVNPQIILLGDALWGGITPEIVAARGGWETLSAVQEGRVYPFDDNLASRPGPRLVDGLEALAKILHPDLFK